LVDKNKTDKPAQLQYTNPDEGRSTVATDVGVAVAYLPSESSSATNIWEYMLGAEHHRNTAQSKKQNTALASISALGVVAVQDNATLFPSASLSWKEDKEKDSASWMASARLALASKQLWLGHVIPIGVTGLLFEPGLGAEYEDVIDSPAGLTANGNALRGVYWIEATFYPLYTVDTGADSTLGERLELVASFKQWQDLAESNFADELGDRHTLIQAGVQYFFDTDKHFGVALTFVNGENPTESKPDQEYVQLSLLVKF